MGGVRRSERLQDRFSGLLLAAFQYSRYSAISRYYRNPFKDHRAARGILHGFRVRCGGIKKVSFRRADPHWRDDARKRVKKELLIFRWLHLFGKTSFEVLLDIFVIFSEPLVHHRVNLFLGFLKVALGYHSRIFTQRQHARFPAN